MMTSDTARWRRSRRRQRWVSDGSAPSDVTIVVLGHWIEMRSIAQAEGAVNELAKLLPDTAIRIVGNRTETVAVSDFERRRSRAPEQKASKVQEVQRQGKRVAMVGRGSGADVADSRLPRGYSRRGGSCCRRDRRGQRATAAPSTVVGRAHGRRERCEPPHLSRARVQLSMTRSGTAASSRGRELIRNFCPSAVTSY
jgi:hypothetical protein